MLTVPCFPHPPHGHARVFGVAGIMRLNPATIKYCKPRKRTRHTGSPNLAGRIRHSRNQSTRGLRVHEGSLRRPAPEKRRLQISRGGPASYCAGCLTTYILRVSLYRILKDLEVGVRGGRRMCWFRAQRGRGRCSGVDRMVHAYLVRKVLPGRKSWKIRGLVGRSSARLMSRKHSNSSASSQNRIQGELVGAQVR